ncbi:MAG: hypothetical protein IPJ34_21980 [Myxococcales bacterium]|nr:hypothetical protein [Myxococcales bacterium]
MKPAVMLEKCKREQWKLTDLDWNAKPREMSREDEMAIVQYFVDMASIERLAGALFREQEQKVDDPILSQIFRSFVADEMRHAAVAERLAEFYDVRHLKKYETNPHLAAFYPCFIETVRRMPPDIANIYITAGELILDVALLRSINDYVHDEMSQRAMDLVNRDESRHIAVDYHMLEYYSSEEYDWALAQRPKTSLRERVAGQWAFANMLWHASPFIRAVFFEPMAVVDPSGKRMKEAFRRMQILGAKPNVKRRPFVRVMMALQELYRRPWASATIGPLLERATGVPGSVLVRLIDEEDERRAARLSFDELAEEALSAKLRD